MMMKSKRESYNLMRACHTEGLLYFKTVRSSLCVGMAWESSADSEPSGRTHSS